MPARTSDHAANESYTNRFIPPVFLALSLAFAICRCAVASDNLPPIERIKGAKSSLEAGRAYRDLFQHADLTTLNRLSKGPDLGIALQAHWRLNNVRVRKQSAEPEGSAITDAVSTNGSTPDRQRISRFIGFFEGRTLIRPPSSWQGAILDAGFVCEQFDVDSPDDAERHPAFAWGPLRLPSNTTAKRVADNAVISMWVLRDRIEFTLPANVLDQLPDTSDEVDEIDRVRFYHSDETTLVALYSSGRSVRFPLRCVDSVSGKIKWSADVWGAGDEQIPFGSGNPRHYAELSCDDRMAVVFGCASTGVYAEGFDLATGKVRFRFASNYWNVWRR